MKGKHKTKKQKKGEKQKRRGQAKPKGEDVVDKEKSQRKRKCEEKITKNAKKTKKDENQTQKPNEEVNLNNGKGFQSKFTKEMDALASTGSNLPKRPRANQKAYKVVPYSMMEVFYVLSKTSLLY